MSKLIERVVLVQLIDHLITHKIVNNFQLAYCAGHSTETALLRVVNDLLVASDNKQVSVLTLLNLSAAFDTIDHTILVHRLQHLFDILDKALEWLRSYPSETEHMLP